MREAPWSGRFQPVSATSSAGFSAGLRNPKVFRGRWFRLFWIRFRSAREYLERSVLLGLYWRSKPLVFSFDPRCHGE